MDYAQLKPDVTHPYVDPLWSTPSVHIINDGGEADRAQKCEVIAAWDLALAHLRVCWGTDGELNCGRCEKCLRTQLALDALGALDRCDVFAAPYEPERIREIAVRSLLVRYHGDTLKLARRRGADHLIDLLTANYRGMCGFELVDDLHERAGEVRGSESWPAISRALRKGLFAHLREHDPGWLIKKTRQLLPGMREPLFQVFWHCCKRWLLRRVIARRLGLGGKAAPAQSPTFSSTRK